MVAWNAAGTEAAFIDGAEAVAFADANGGEVHREGVVYVVRGVTRYDSESGYPVPTPEPDTTPEPEPDTTPEPDTAPDTAPPSWPSY